jgi:hypothetical protein
MKLAINERACTIYNEQTGQTLTESALHYVVARANAYPKLVAALKAKARGELSRKAAADILKELGEPCPYCGLHCGDACAEIGL